MLSFSLALDVAVEAGWLPKMEAVVVSCPGSAKAVQRRDPAWPRSRSGRTPSYLENIAEVTVGSSS